MRRLRVATALVGGLRKLVGARRSGAAVVPLPSVIDSTALETLLDRVRRHGDTWIRDTAPVALPLLTGDGADGWTRLGELRRDGDGWVAPTDDPGLVGPSVAWGDGPWRYVLLEMAATTAGGSARGQLFWDDGAGFDERASRSWPVIADGTMRRYAIDLGTGTATRRLRIDPLDRPGRIAIARMTLIADLAQVEPGGDLRAVIARRYIRGAGVECGALQNPMTVPPAARVTYIDRLTLADARAHYPELDGQPLTAPHLVADLQRLPVGDDRLDFCIGNHLLEHARDPIGGLCEFLRTIRPGGIAFVSVPDVGNPLDRGRPVTPFTHLLDDHRAGVDRRTEDARHYDESVAAAHPELPAAELQGLIERFRAQAYSIHFHTFDEASFRALVAHAVRLVPAVVEEYARNRTPEFDEYIAVLRRLPGDASSSGHA